MQLGQVWFTCFTYPFSRSLTEGYCLYKAISARLAGNNSIIKVLILRILKALELFFNHEFYCRLPGLTNVYSNGKIIPGQKFFANYKSLFEIARGLWVCQNSINHEDLLDRSLRVKDETNM